MTATGAQLLWSACLVLLTSAASLPTATACPVGCNCYQTNGSGSHVTCANQSLLSVPENLPNGFTSLDLHGNRLVSLTNVFQNATRLTDLDISFNNLLALNVSSFAELWSLKQLNLRNNSVVTIEPKTFSQMPKLEELTLSNNKLEALDAMIFFGLFHLKVLILQQNEISTLSPSTFLYVNTLESLDLSNNRIRELPTSIFDGLYKLRYLYLQGNMLMSLESVQYPSLSNLVYLDMSHNALVLQENVSFTSESLQHLRLGWNSVSQIPSEIFKNATMLTSLYMDGNPVSVIKESSFRDLHNLQILSLTHMSNLTYLSKHTFEGLQNLTVLNLSHNHALSFINSHLFSPLSSLQVLDLGDNNITALQNTTFRANHNLQDLRLHGNNFQCDCGIEWLLELMRSNNSIIGHPSQLQCRLPYTSTLVRLETLDTEALHCDQVRIVNFTTQAKYKIGSSAILRCEAESDTSLVITWITPRKHVFTYSYFNEYATLSPAHHDDHSWHSSSAYYTESELSSDRLVLLQDGSLYIDYVTRMDAGFYTCIVSNPRNETKAAIHITLDYKILDEVKIWSLIVGFSCAGSFFLLNLIYSLSSAAVRRCVSQRRRARIRQLIESLDHYKTSQISRIKENYNYQVGRIRDQYHYQLGRLREHNTQKMDKIKEGCSNKVDRIRENYNNQLARLKDYSSNQMLQIRERYNNQILRMKDYGSSQFGRIHEKYKLQQQHVIKLLDLMNLDNCRTVFETECVRTESMILRSDLFTEDVLIPSPIDTASLSDSEYMTATSSESSTYTSRENIEKADTEPSSEPASDEQHGPYMTASSGSLSLSVSNLQARADATETPLLSTACDEKPTCSTDFEVVPGPAEPGLDPRTKQASKKRSRHRQRKQAAVTHEQRTPTGGDVETGPWGTDGNQVFIDMPELDTCDRVRESVV